MIPHSKPWITEADLAAASEVLASAMLGQGEKTRQLEHALSEWVGGEDGVAVGSGSAALALAMLALGIGRGDEVVVPGYVCTSVVEAVLTVGATPVLCDVGEDWVVSHESMAPRVTPRTRALVVPHMYGLFADVASFRTFGVPIIEDCAQAVADKGARPLLGDIGVFSLHPTKCLTAGEGGLAISRDRSLVVRMRSIRDGTADAGRGRLFSPLSDLAAALGISQLARYHEALDHRRRLAQKYTQALQATFPADVASHAKHHSMFFRFPLKIRGGLDAYQEQFAQRGVCIRRGVDRLLSRLRGEPDRDFRNAVMLFDTTISLPIYPALTDEAHVQCMKAAEEIFASAALFGRS